MKTVIWFWRNNTDPRFAMKHMWACLTQLLDPLEATLCGESSSPAILAWGQEGSTQEMFPYKAPWERECGKWCLFPGGGTIP